MSNQPSRSVRLRYTAIGALAALAAVGGVAGTAALAARPSGKAHGHAAVANHALTKAPDPTCPEPSKSGTPPPPVNPQPFLDAIQQLVDNGTITTAQAQTVDRQIQAGRIDTDTLTGFTAAQLGAVEQALGNAKRALAPASSGPQK